MLKALIKKDLSEVLYRSFRRSGRARRNGKPRAGFGKGMAVLLLVLVLYLMGLFALLAYYLCNSIAAAGLGWLYFLLFAVIAIIAGTLGSVFSTYSALYLAKDNDLLLSMPIPIRDILLSRLLSVYVAGLLYSAIASLPAVVMYQLVLGFSVPALLGGLALILLISLVVLGLSCLLGWGVAKLSRRLKNRSFVTVLIALGFLALYYVVYFRLMSNAQALLESVIAFGSVIKERALPVYLLGAIGEGDWLGILLWFGMVGAFLALLWLLLKKTFLSIATASDAPKRAVYKERTARQGSADAALLRREWLRFRSSANYMLNCGLGLILLPGLSIYLLIKGRALFEALTSSLAGFSGLIPVAMGAACAFMGSMMDVSAPSVSLEGKTLWQVQSLPVTAWQVLRAKLRLHLSLAALPSALWVVCILAVVPVGMVERLLLAAVSLLCVLWTALLGLTLGLKMANLSWTNEIVPIKQSGAVVITVFAGIGLGVAILGLYLIFATVLSSALWLGIVAVLLLLADAILYLRLRGSGTRRFSDLS